MQPSRTGFRHFLFDRYFERVMWAFWALASVLTVGMVVIFAPHSTFAEWVDVVVIAVGLVVIPISLILRNYGHASRAWRFVIYLSIVWAWVAFGLLMADWVKPASVEDDASRRFAFGLFFGMLPAMGPAMVMSHLDRVRMAREKAEELADTGARPVERESDTA